ncbi:hypothetical protein B0E37_04165 [Streptomyces sp. MH192]|nr:hypothetical protein [Streptomyces sp. MH192]MCF0101179.1 hypothetical protein [Streptomyces sp. MH191]
MDRVVPALGRADRPGAADVGLARGERVVGPLAEGRPDGVDGRQVDDVETHLRDGRKSFRGGAEGAVQRRVRLPALAAREELVPRAEQRPLPLHPERERGRGGDEFAQGVGGQDRPDAGGERGPVPGLRGTGPVAQCLGGGEERGAGRRVGHPVGGPLVQSRTLLQHQLDVLAGRDLDSGVVPPGGDGVAPRLHPVGPVADRRRGDLGAPAVGAGGQLPHRRPGPRTALRIRQHDVGGDRVVALREERGGDLEGLPLDGLRRTPAALDERPDVQDRNAADGGIGVHRCRLLLRRPVPAAVGVGGRVTVLARRSGFSVVGRAGGRAGAAAGRGRRAAGGLRPWGGMVRRRRRP